MSPPAQPAPDDHRRHRSRTLQVLRSSAAATEVGAPPGTVFANPDAESTRVTVYEYDREHLRTVDGLERWEEDLPAARQGVTWVRVQGLARVDVLERIAKMFGIHRLAVADIVNANQRSKVEEYEEHVFLVLHAPALGETDRLETTQLALLLGRDFLLTFEERASALLDPVAARAGNPQGQLRRSGADYLAYAVLDTVVDSFFPLIEAYGEHLEAVESGAIERPDETANRAIHAVRADLLLLRRAIWPLREIANELHRGIPDLIEETTRLYLRDCYDHAIHLQETIEIYREIAFGLVEIYMSSLNQRMNEVMKVLTIIATIFMPLGFLASLYGMNFDRRSPWNMPELGWPLGYPLALGLMAVIAASMVWYFRAKGWIGARPPPERMRPLGALLHRDRRGPPTEG